MPAKSQGKSVRTVRMSFLSSALKLCNYFPVRVLSYVVFIYLPCLITFFLFAFALSL